MKKNKKLPIKEKVILGIKKTGKVFFYAFGFLLSVILMFFIYINLPVRPSNDEPQIGVTFSHRYAQDINIDWRAAYIAMLDELHIKHIRIPVYWDSIEKNEGELDFTDLDWQLQQAAQRDAKVILVIGKKVPRWPECYVPSWVGSPNSETVPDKLLSFEEKVINRYKDGHPEISSWQVENEPFLAFGICGTIDDKLLDREIAQTKKLDPTRQIIVTDSGELSLWLKAASRADIFGTTMYREVYSAEMGHWRYPIGPNFFKVKQLFIKYFANQENAIVIELQGEPWVEGWTTNAPIERQLESMNASILVENIEFAKKTEMKEIYVWGVEWWYWMKMNQNNPTLWETAKTFNN